MEERASIAPELPATNPTVSYWQDPPSPLANHRTTTELPTTTDVLIIGSGITGATLAYRLLNRPSPPAILMLEARTVCSDLGEDEAARIARFKYDCMRNVHDFARKHGIDCDSWQGDTTDIFYDQGQLEKAKRAVGEINRVLGDVDPATRYRFWDAQETREKFLIEGSFGAVSYEAGSLWPYKLVVGILELAIMAGLNLQTWTPALELQRELGSKSWVVQTPRGKVRAKKVLLATNGYTARICPALQGVIVPLRGHMTAQRPGSGLLQDGLATTYSFIYDDGYEYMIPRPKGTKFAGDIMIGGGATKARKKGIYEFGTTDDTSIDSTILEYLKDSAATRFGSHWGDDSPDGRIRTAWTGIMGYSADGFPLVGEIPDQDDLYIAASFQGSGMVLCFDSADALISIMCKENEAHLDRWFPKAFRMTAARTKHKFRGRLHTTVVPMDLEVKSRV